MMDSRMISMLGGVSALALLGTGAAVAAPAIPELQPIRPAQSFAELLDPIPNAVSVLQRDDARMASESDGLLQLAQYDGDGYYHHHHHHHHHFRRYYRQEYVPFRGYHHHHHHHHHHHWHHQYYGD